MTNILSPGQKGEVLPDHVIVIRLARLASNTLETQEAHESHFSLSSDDEKSELQSLSVWAEDLTPAKTAQSLMGANRAAYRLALYLKVDDIRTVKVNKDFPIIPLQVVWDPDIREGAQGHAGIVGLMRMKGIERSLYKALRIKLRDCVRRIEILPENYPV